ncbi:MAG: hypothetical protein ACPGJK_00380 [Paracoccaceae bacterium]
MKTRGQKRPCKGFHFGQLRIYNAAGCLFPNMTAMAKGQRRQHGALSHLLLSGVFNACPALIKHLNTRKLCSPDPAASRNFHFSHPERFSALFLLFSSVKLSLRGV